MLGSRVEIEQNQNSKLNTSEQRFRPSFDQLNNHSINQARGLSICPSIHQSIRSSKNWSKSSRADRVASTRHTNEGPFGLAMYPIKKSPVFSSGVKDFKI
mmetsp:Transcript_41719/g.104833  ORF Transcript_41719/g.104833 Transcript_41719/m.104833 type:complete len:100 (+) Transcript_41719:318-617(+)